MSINQQIDALIASAKAGGATVDDVTDEIRLRWDFTAGIALKVDEFGRHSIPGSRLLFLSPLPILLGMKLSALQYANIMPNCGVNAEGDEVPAAFLGFTDETGGNQQVAYLAARQYSSGMKPGDPTPVFQPLTRRARFRTIDEAVQYVAANPWVQ